MRYPPEGTGGTNGTDEHFSAAASTTSNYVADAAALGMNKGLIMLGHVISEQPGMDDVGQWLGTFVKGVPIKYVPADEPFWT